MRRQSKNVGVSILLAFRFIASNASWKLMPRHRSPQDLASKTHRQQCSSLFNLTPLPLFAFSTSPLSKTNTNSQTAPNTRPETPR
jgi:hypothetical protein